MDAWSPAALWALLTLLFHGALALACAVHILLHKRDPVSAFGWLATCLLFPLAGAVLYLLFGVNRIRTRARKLGLPPAARVPAAVPLAPRLPAPARLIAQVSAALTGRPLLAGNAVTPLFGLEQAFPDMLAAVAGARRSILLATYLFGTDHCGRRFIAALARARRRGVAVRVLIDGVGEHYHCPRAGPLLARAGIEVARFLPPRLLPPQLHLNLRNHRKLLIVDGKVAYTGGMNLVCKGRRRHPCPPRLEDLHFRLEGPVVAELGQVFAEDWRFAGGRAFALEAPPPPAGPALCRTVVDGPNEDLDTLPMLLEGVISTARRRVLLMTPYFLPPRGLLEALQVAALRGVRVEVILPERSNLPFVDWACRRLLPELLARGVRVYLRPGPFAHSKLYLVDDHYALIGSPNLDPRSLALNFEIGVEIYDEGTVAGLAAHAAEVRDRCRPLTLEELERRPLAVKLRDAVFWLFSGYL
ncbi:MAG: cardiolipin synthase [Gammaproteobacteria bacterium]|nr:MAG: cardiolipin synthase [Gammaproteobacteria bacterium]